MVIAIEAALSALLQDLDVAVAERDFAVARNTLDVGGHVLAVLDRDADILSVEVRAEGCRAAAGMCSMMAYCCCLLLSADALAVIPLFAAGTTIWTYGTAIRPHVRICSTAQEPWKTAALVVRAHACHMSPRTTHHAPHSTHHLPAPLQMPDFASWRHNFQAQLSERRAQLAAILEHILGEAASSPPEARSAARTLAQLTSPCHAASVMLGGHAQKIRQVQAALLRQHSSGAPLL